MYPVGYEADYQERHNRWITGFRAILFIPWGILQQYIYPIAVGVISVIVWFGMLFTARYPQWAWEFVIGFLRFNGRVNAFAFLQTDKWPSFGFGADPDYPIRIPIGPPQERYNRWKVAFRLILGIPAIFMLFLLSAMTIFATIASWFTIVFRGYQPTGIHNTLTVGLAYTTRVTAYFLLVTEALPPVSDQGVAPSGPPAA